MEFDRDFFEGIKNMDNGALSDAIQMLAEGMGVDKSLVQYYLRDMNKVKEAVSGLDRESFEKIRATLGEEKTNEVMENIRSKMKGE